MTTTAPPEFAALVLASGAFTETGRPLALGRWGSTTVVEHVTAVAAAEFTSVLVVLGCDGERVAASVDLRGATVIIDPEWSEGVASPLRAGLDTLSRMPQVEHAVVFDCSTPEVHRRVVRELVAAHLAAPHAMQGRRVGDGSATVPKYRYARSGPLILARDLWERFLSMEGSAPLLQTLSVHPDWANEVWIDRLPPAEVASTDDLERVAPRR